MTQPLWGATNAEPARPRRTPVADIFDEAFRLYRENFAVMTIVFAAFQVPIVLIGLPFWAAQAQWYAQPLPSPAELVSIDIVGWMAAAAIGLSLAGLVLGTFAGAGIAHIVRRARTGDRPSAGEVFRALRRDAGSVLSYALILMAGLFGVGLVLAVVLLILLGIAGPGAAIGTAILGGLVAGVAIVAIGARLALSIPALVVERRGARAAIERSWALVAGSTLRTFGILLLGSLVVGIVAGLVNPVYIPQVAQGFLTGSVWSYVVVGLVTGLVQILVGPILPTVMTILYFDYVAARVADADKA